MAEQRCHDRQRCAIRHELGCIGMTEDVWRDVRIGYFGMIGHRRHHRLHGPRAEGSTLLTPDQRSDGVLLSTPV